jgi:hypothetical protein
MILPDGSVLMHGDLEHRAPYDPRKAREYYLRTRKLKGRERGAGGVADLGAHVVPIRGFNAPKVKPKSKPISNQQMHKAYMSDVAWRLGAITQGLEQKMRDAHQKSVKVPKREGDKKEEPQLTAEELRNQISNLKGRLTSAIDKLEKIETPAP